MIVKFIEKDSRSYSEKEEEMQSSLNSIAKVLVERGIALNVGGCGCCSSPWLKIKIDGEIVFDSGDASLDMISRE